MKRHAGKVPIVTNLTFAEMIARNDVPGASNFLVYGCNPSVGSDIAEVWDGVDPYPWSDDAERLTLTSTSPDDRADGPGAQKVVVHGLDEEGYEASEEVALDGTSGVLTSGLFYRVSGALNSEKGSAGGAQGDILIHRGADLVAKIPQGQGRALMAVLTVPTGRTGYLSTGYAVSSSRDIGQVSVWYRVNGSGGPWTKLTCLFVTANGIQTSPAVPFPMAAGTDLKVMARRVRPGLAISVAAYLGGWFEDVEGI